MGHGLGPMGQRPHPWPAVQSALPAHLGPDFSRRHREIPLLRHDPWRGAGVREEIGTRTFGEKVFDIIETSPDRLREVDGIGPVRATNILVRATRRIRVFLFSGSLILARGAGAPADKINFRNQRARESAGVSTGRSF